MEIWGGPQQPRQTGSQCEVPCGEWLLQREAEEGETGDERAELRATGVHWPVRVALGGRPPFCEATASPPRPHPS